VFREAVSSYSENRTDAKMMLYERNDFLCTEVRSTQLPLLLKELIKILMCYLNQFSDSTSM